MTIQATTIVPSTFIFRVPGRAYCPGCAAAITQQTYMVHRDILWCLRCGEHPLDRTDWLSIASSWTDLSHQWTHVRGLRVWTPSDPLDGIVTHYLKSREESRKAPPSDLIDDYQAMCGRQAMKHHGA